MSYTMTSAGFDSSNPEHVNRARLAGVNLAHGVEGIQFSSTRSQSTKNCYILCMTKEFSPEVFAEDFGRHCVEISRPAVFFDMINAAMRQSNMFKIAGAASILYVDRDYAQENVPVRYPVGFVKPPDLYASQKEFRFLWTVDNPEAIKPFSLHVPGVSHLLRKLVIPHPIDRVDVVDA